MSKYYKNGALRDKEIVKALREAAKLYENGDIVEVDDMLIEIHNAIVEFCDDYDPLSAKG